MAVNPLEGFYFFLDNSAGVYIYAEASKGGFEHLSNCSIEHINNRANEQLSV